MLSLSQSFYILFDLRAKYSCSVLHYPQMHSIVDKRLKSLALMAIEQGLVTKLSDPEYSVVLYINVSHQLKSRWMFYFNLMYINFILWCLLSSFTFQI